MRQGRSTGTKVLVTIPKNTTVTISQTSGTWSKTTYRGKTGWVASRYLKSASAAKPPAKATNRKVTTYNLNLRQGRSTGTKVLVTIPKNTTVTISQTSGTWSKTTYRGKTGWVASRYLKNASAAKIAYRWTTANVNVRKGAGTSYASLGVVRADERVTYLRTASGWSNVKTSKGTGWISNRYLDAHGQHPVAVYGTLRKGQSAYHLLRGRTTSETRTRIANFNMYLKPDQTWWSFIIPSSSSARSVVVERMDIRPASYRATLADLDKWERFDPRKPLADQNYNRKLVTDKDGKRSWAYVGASKISNYLVKNGIRVTSGDYLRRY
nr:SH3 domain-containing protein [Paeniglutamicibacter quisquiliarum]